MNINDNILDKVSAAGAQLVVVTKYFDTESTNKIIDQLKNIECVIGFGENRVEKCGELFEELKVKREKRRATLVSIDPAAAGGDTEGLSKRTSFGPVGRLVGEGGAGGIEGGRNAAPPQSLNSHSNSGPPSGGGRNTAPLKKGEASNTFEEQEAEGFINTSPLAGGIKGGSSNNKNSKIPDHASFHSAVRDDIKLLKLNPRTILERLLRHVQIKKIKSNPDYQTPGACIILDDDELRFHPVRKNRGIN